MSIGREHGIEDSNLRHVPSMDVAAAAELLAIRARQAEANAAVEAARRAHLEELSGEHAVITPEDLNR